MFHTFWQHYLAYLSDPAHSLVEVTNTVVIDFVILGMLVPFLRRTIRREHTRIDTEHGFSHDDDDLPIPYVPGERWEQAFPVPSRSSGRG